MSTSVRRPLAALLVADVVSTAGTEMTAVALPWLVLTTTGSPARMGAVLAAEFVGLALLGLAGGRAAALLGARRLMLVSDLTRAALIAVVPVQYALGVLSFPALLAVAFAIGAFFPAYSSCQRLVAAELLGDDEVRLTRFGGLSNAVNETASFLGPALGGVLVAVAGSARVLVIDSLSYLVAFGLVAAFIPRRRSSTVEDEVGGSVRAGLRFLLGHARLRREIAGVGLISLSFCAMLATLPVLALRADAGSRAAGWLLGAYGLGSVAGGLLSTRARAADGRMAAMAVAGLAGSAWLVAVGSPLWLVGVGVGLVGVCSGLFFPRFFAAVTTGTPTGLRATVMTAVNVLISAPGPLGFLGAGLLNQSTAGVRASLALVALAATAAAALLLWSRTTSTEVADAPDAVTATHSTVD